MARKKVRGKKYRRGSRKPVWSLDDGVTYSSLSTYLECREQFSLSYIEGLTNKKISGPLEFGSIIHYCLEHQFDYQTARECSDTVCRQYRDWRVKTLLNSSEKDELEELVNLARITFPLYASYWEVDDKHITWVDREEKFDVPYELETEGGLRRLRLRGMRDGVLRIGDRLGLFETKTKSRINELEITSGLRSDMQTLFYCFTTYLQKQEMPRFVEYNIIRRGGLYRRKGETTRKYLQRVELDVKKKPDHYFKRFRIELLPHDILNFQKMVLDPLLRAFLQWYDSVKKNPFQRSKSPYHFPNLNALVGKYGKANMWEAMVNGNRNSYYVRSAPFPELEESFLVTQEN